MAVAVREVTETVYRDRIVEAVNKKMEAGMSLRDASDATAQELLKSGGSVLGLFKERGGDFIAFIWRGEQTSPVLRIINQSHNKTERRRPDDDETSIVTSSKYSPLLKRFIPFSEFGRADCFAEADRVQKLAATYDHEYAFLMAVGKRLKDGEKVGQRFDEKSLVTLAQKVKV